MFIHTYIANKFDIFSRSVLGACAKINIKKNKEERFQIEGYNTNAANVESRSSF